MTKRLGFCKLCARWVLKFLSKKQKKKQQMNSVLDFLTRYDKDGDKFISLIVMEGKTWGTYDTLESKWSSMKWRHTFSMAKVKPKQILTFQKVMCIVFWDRQGILLLNFRHEMKQSIKMFIVRHIRNCATQFRIHINAWPHTTNVTKTLLQGSGGDVFGYPLYSPDLASSDFHLFL